MDYSAAAQGHNNASSPDFGIVAWGVSSSGWSGASYGDDNARVIMGSMLASASLGRLASSSEFFFPSAEWDKMIGKSVLGNLRLCSVHGFRPGRINYPDLFSSGGWQKYRYSGEDYANASSPQPHYQAQMWAVFLLAYARTCATGACFLPLYTTALAGLESTMAAYIASYHHPPTTTPESGGGGGVKENI